MKTQIQFTLLLAAALYMGWGLTLLLAPMVAHALISTGPYDPVVTALLGAALIAFTVTFLIAARDPVKEIVRASSAAMVLIGFTAAFFIFISKSMPLSFVTVVTLLIDLAAAGVLFLAEAKLDLLRHARPVKSRSLRASGRKRKRYA
jgi:hypothetical protein